MIETKHTNLQALAQGLTIIFLVAALLGTLSATISVSQYARHHYLGFHDFSAPESNHSQITKGGVEQQTVNHYLRCSVCGVLAQDTPRKQQQPVYTEQQVRQFLQQQAAGMKKKAPKPAPEPKKEEKKGEDK